MLNAYHAALIWDEPTTHLDQTSINLLIEELRYDDGTLFLVSHDRHLLNQLTITIREIEDETMMII